MTIADGGRVQLELLVGEDITELSVTAEAGEATLQDGSSAGNFADLWAMAL